MYTPLKQPDSVELLDPSFPWVEWPERWKNAPDGITRLGLIYGVFDTRVDFSSAQDEERTRYILELVCEYTPDFNSSVLQRQIWAAGITVLQRRFFTPRKSGAEIHALSPSLIEAIFWFYENTFHLRDDRWTTRSIISLNDHALRELKWFFTNLWTIIWDDTYKSGKHAQFKPVIVRLMIKMGTLSLLMPNAHGAGSEGMWRRFDQASIDVLEELAFKDAGRVLTLEDAVRRGSQAAILLFALRSARPHYAKEK